MQIGKEEVKLCHADDTILNIENYKTNRNVRINELSKVSGYQNNIQKFIVFLDTNSELSEKEI